MKISQVKKLKPIERIVYWITERERIRLRKESGDPQPWTDDEILAKFKFCNVRRMDDKVSKWLHENWYRPFFNHPNMVVACALARQLNTIESLEAIGFPAVWNPKKMLSILESRMKKGLKTYSSAYMITSNYGERGRDPETKPYQTLYRVCNPINEGIKSGALQVPPDSMEETWRTLCGCMGFSSFISGQVTADLRWAIECDWPDKDNWAAVGPGSSRGMYRLLQLPVKVSMHQKEFDVRFPHYVDSLLELLPGSITNRLEAIDFQNCLCEWDKYERTLWDQGKPKQLYAQVSTK